MLGLGSSGMVAKRVRFGSRGCTSGRWIDCTVVSCIVAGSRGEEGVDGGVYERWIRGV